MVSLTSNVKLINTRFAPLSQVLIFDVLFVPLSLCLFVFILKINRTKTK